MSNTAHGYTHLIKGLNYYFCTDALFDLHGYNSQSCFGSKRIISGGHLGKLRLQRLVVVATIFTVYAVPGKVYHCRSHDGTFHMYPRVQHSNFVFKVTQRVPLALDRVHLCATLYKSKKCS